MPLTDLDAVWFRIHPDREYRLRQQTAGELEQWPVPPREGLTGWCIIRRTDGGMELFAIAAGETSCDCDGCLEDFFAHLTEQAA